MSAASLIDRLSKVKQTAPDRWIAACPSHEDKSPSLSIREVSDGRVLVKCFAGCGAADVVAAVGLNMSDLFPARLPEHQYRPSRSRIPAGDLLEVIDHEALVVSMICADFLEKREMGESEWSRLSDAVRRIGGAREHAR